MKYLLALIIAGTLALGAGVHAQDSREDSISTGESRSYDFAGEEPIVVTLDARGTALVRITNIGRDSVLTAYDEDGQFLLRAAGWRGPEHHYYAIFDLDRPVRLSIEPDDPVSPPGRIQVSVEAAPADDRYFAAERAMTRAADLNLVNYYGDGNTRSEALRMYQEAASLFAEAGNKARQADALFEAANVSDILCNRRLAHQQLERAGGLWSELGDERGMAVAENLRGLIHWNAGNGAAAVALFDASAGRRKQLGDDYFYAESINNLGLVHRKRGDARLAMQYFLAALDIWQGDADILHDDLESADWQALPRPPSLRHSLTALNNLGWANEVFGDIEDSERTWSRALALTKHLSNDFTAATLQINLGNLKRRSGNMQEAMDLLERAVTYFRDVSPDEFFAGFAHFNMGQLHRDLGDRTRALEFFRQSLAYRSPDCDPVGRAESLKEIAEIELEAGNADSALDLINEGHELLAPLPGNAVAEARLQELEGRALLKSGRHGDALLRFEQAIDLYRGAGDRLGELTTRTERARTNSELGKHFAAIAELRTALDLAGQVDSRLEEFRVLTALGETYLADDAPGPALEHARQAISISESVRAQLVRPILLRDFASVQRSAYDILVRAYLALDDVQNAWIASDSGRARRFSDVIRQSDVDLSALSRQQQGRYRFLVSAIAQRAEARTELLTRNEQESAAVVLRELMPLVDEMDVLLELARRPEIEADISLSLETLQSMLGEGDAVLEYYVGKALAGVWSITRTDLFFREIPLSGQLSPAVESVVASMRRRQSDVSADLRRLAHDLLDLQALQDSAHHNLVIIPDGPLHYVPFAALHDPATGWREPLIENRTVTYLPSLRVLWEMRRRQSDDSSGIAILADPVFQADDPRVRQEAPAEKEVRLAFLDHELLRSAERNGVTGFPRLPATRLEAEAIEAAAGDMDVLPLYGVDANRDVVMSGRLKPFRILHFATHGVLDDVEPALSGLVLSAVRPDGRRRSSFLRSQDILGLTLDAQLVVLSGCETGLGRPVNGEGLVGLSRAFFYAGATQVVSTLWQVPDNATAALMAHFYRELLRGRAGARDALRHAQIEVRKDSRWQQPYYWAPFIIQGDWN